MQHLFGPEGDSTLAALLRLQPLLVFDFDGTLAPIVARPNQARLSQGVGRRLRALAAQLPVAIVTGRSVADARARLGFDPIYLIGNHGAEDVADPAGAARRTAALNDLRLALREHGAELAGAGVTVEDKGPSIALHYRLSRQRENARRLIDGLLAPLRATLRIFAGKMVVNAMAADAQDKAQAVISLVERSGARSAMFAGDDVNDEPVFRAAPAHWLTLRIGRDDPTSCARFGLDGPQEVALMLERVLALLAAQSGR